MYELVISSVSAIIGILAGSGITYFLLHHISYCAISFPIRGNENYFHYANDKGKMFGEFFAVFRFNMHISSRGSMIIHHIHAYAYHPGMEEWIQLNDSLDWKLDVLRELLQNKREQKTWSRMKKK